MIIAIFLLISPLVGLTFNEVVDHGLAQPINIEESTEDHFFNLEELMLQKQAYYLPTLSLRAKGGKSESFILNNSQISRFKRWGTDHLITPSLQFKTIVGTEINLSRPYSHYIDTRNSFDLSIRQPLLKGALPSINRINLENAKDQVMKSDINNRETVNKNILLFAEHYFMLKRATFSNQVEKNNYEEIRHNLINQQELFKAGKISQEDLRSTELQANQIHLDFKRSQIDLKKVLKSFKQLTGIEYQDGESLPLPTLNWDIPDFSSAASDLETNNFTIQKQKIDIAKQSRQVDVTRENQWPDLTLNYSRKWDISKRQLAKVGATSDKELFIELSIDSNFKQRRLELDRAKSKLKFDQLKLAQQQQEAIEDLQHKIDIIENLSDQISINESSIKHDTEIVKSIETNFQHGKKSLVDVFKAKNELHKKQLELINQKKTLFVEQLALANHMGIYLLDLLYQSP